MFAFVEIESCFPLRFAILPPSNCHLPLLCSGGEDLIPLGAEDRGVGKYFSLLKSLEVPLDALVII